MGLGLGLGIQFSALGGIASKVLTWGRSIPARFWGTESPEYWGGIDAQAQVHYNRVIADGGVVPAGLGGVNSFFQVVKGVYGTTDINTAISAAYDAHYLGYKLGAGSGTTLGQAARTLYAPKGIFGGIGTGSAFWEGVGVTGNYVQTPSAAINQITGDIEIVARISISDEVGEKTIISKRSGANASYVLSSTSKLLRFRINTTTYDSNASHTFAVNEVYWAKVTRQQSNGEIKFFTSLNGTTWTQLGTTIIGITDSIAVNSVPVIVGVLGDLSSFSMKGNIYRATIANSIGGTPVVDFNANQYTGANTWTSTTSEVWTVNSTGAGLADVVQTTAASQPLLLAHTGENYWFGSGIASNFVSTPNAAANQITGDIDCIAYVNYVDNGTYQIILSKSAATYAYSFYVNGTGANSNLELEIGSPQSSVISSVSLGASFNGWVRVTRAVTGGIVKFYTSLDSVSTSIGSISWTQNGIDRTLLAGTPINNTSNNLFVGVYGSNILPFQGKIYRATISNSIGGTPVVDFNPASYNPSVSQTQWSSATGEVWTISTGTAATGYKGVLVDRSIVQGDGVDDKLVTSGTIGPLTDFSTYLAVEPLGIGGTSYGKYVDSGYVNQFALGVDNVTLTNLHNSYKGPAGIPYGATIAVTPRTLQLFTGSRTSATGVALTYINNSGLVTNNLGSSGATTANAIGLFGRTDATSQFGNSIINSFVLTLIADNSTQRTAMYNALKGFNNNSF